MMIVSINNQTQIPISNLGLKKIFQVRQLKYQMKISCLNTINNNDIRRSLFIQQQQPQQQPSCSSLLTTTSSSSNSTTNGANYPFINNNSVYRIPIYNLNLNLNNRSQQYFSYA